MLEVYIQEVEGGDILQLPMAPDRIQVSTATTFLSYDIMNVGEHRIPRGEELTGFKWTAILPGEGRKDAPYVQAWQDPSAIVNKFSMWKNKGKKLKLTVSKTPINHAVFLVSVQYDFSGGMGDIEYTVEFCVAKEVIVGTEDDAAEQDSAGAGVKTTAPATQPPAATTYTVKSGDSLWKIAQNTLGDGSRWREIYDMNKDTVGSNPNLIYPGQVYNLPAK